MEPGKTALVLSGGGSRGAAEAGFYRALVELGIKVDFVIGASVGAINGAFIASGMTPAWLSRLWRDFSRSRRFSFNWSLLHSPFGADSLLRTEGLRRFLAESLPLKNFETLPLPLTVVATGLLQGAPLYIEGRGDLVTALMASTALPLYFPPVWVDGEQCVDGGVTDNSPLAAAVARGASRVFCFRCDCDADMSQPARGLLDVHNRSFHIAIKQGLRRDMDACWEKAKLVVVDSCLLSSPALLDFSRSEELIEQAYHASLAHLSGAVDE